jgi:hypothetical protein
VEYFEQQITVTQVGRFDGYNHEVRDYHVDLTTFTRDPIHQMQQDKMAAVIRTMFEWRAYDGPGGSTVQRCQYEGPVGRTEIEHGEYGVHRFTVRVRTSGTD